LENEPFTQEFGGSSVSNATSILIKVAPFLVQRGEFPVRPPKVLILCIGVNDLLSHQSVEETFGHVSAPVYLEF
jgi:lysophospholipase L1-like esterase